MNWSEAQLADHLKRRGAPGAANTADVSDPPFLPAFGSIEPLEKMNKTETAYDGHLWALRGRLYVWHRFEGITLKLADDTRYTPDFIVQTVSGAIELHEVKGFWRDDARVKIKVAAALYPFRFIAVTSQSKKDGGGWKVEEF